MIRSIFAFIKYFCGVALFVALVVVPYQNCSRVDMKAVRMQNSSSSGGGGNGDGYEGKPGIYDHAIVANPCSDKGANGQALPNNEVFLYKDGTADLVRKNCVDLTPPQSIDPSTLTYNSQTKTVTVGTETFNERVQTDFDVIAAQCPGGMTGKPIALSQRVNMLGDSQYLLSSNWMIDSALSRTLVGSMASLPAFQIFRQTTANEYWRRILQVPFLTANKYYAFSFFMKVDSIDKVVVNFQQCKGTGCAPQMNFELVSESINSQIVNPTGTNGATYSIRSFAGGRIITVYFHPDSTYPTEMGIAPWSELSASPQGESILATALQLEDVSTFCQ